MPRKPRHFTPPVDPWLPNLFPLVLLQSQQHTLAELIDAYTRTIHFSLHHDEDGVRLHGWGDALPTEWLLTRDPDGTDIIVEERWDSDSKVVPEEQRTTLNCRIREKGGITLTLLHAAVPPNVTGAASITNWIYERRRPLNPNDRTTWVLYHWAEAYRRAEHLVAVQRVQLPVVIKNWQQLLQSSLEAIARVIPSFAAIARSVAERPTVTADDLKKLQTLLAPEVPPEYREYVYAPSREILRAGSRTIEVLNVMCVVRPSEDHIARATLTIQTDRGPGQRSARGFKFLRDLLGVVPPMAKQNTGGREFTYELDVGMLEFAFSWNIVEMSHQFTNALHNYATCYEHLRPALDAIFAAFEKWDEEESCMVVPVSEMKE